MKTIEVNDSLDLLNKFKDKITLCLGYFDGLHIAHQRLINEAKIKSDGKIGIITFKDNFKNNKVITPLDERLNLFKTFDIDYVFVLPFNKNIQNLSYIDFKEKFIDKINPSLIVCGEDFLFGKDKKGNINYLKKFYKVFVIKTIKFKNKKISSSEIIKLIKEGKINEANKLLTRPYEMSGKVVEGYKNGRKINFPTANVGFKDDYVVPKFGVYKVICYINGIPKLAIANVGIHPTLDKLNDPIIEIHIPNYSGNLYNKKVYVQFIDFIRPERKFSSIETLIKQIKKDIESIYEDN